MSHATSEDVLLSQRFTVDPLKVGVIYYYLSFFTDKGTDVQRECEDMPKVTELGKDLLKLAQRG